MRSDSISKSFIVAIPVCFTMLFDLSFSIAQDQTQEGFPVSCRDSLDVEVTVTKKPRRIVSLAPSITEILFALGLSDPIVGVTRFCNYPPEAQKKEKIGGFADAIPEKVVALRPDLVIGTRGNSLAIVTQLRKLKLKVFITAPKTLDDVMRNVEVIGRLTGQTDEARRVVQKMKSDLAQTKEKVCHIKDRNKCKVYFNISPWAPPLYTAGKGTFINDLIKLAGGVNIAGDSKVRWPQYNLEKIFVRNPDVLIRGVEHFEGEATVQEDRELLRTKPGWRDMKAVKDGRIYVIHSGLVLRPTPRLTEGLKRIAEILYPQLYGSQN